MATNDDDLDRLRDEAHRAAETLTVRAREIRQIIADLPANTSKASRSHLELVATQLDEVAVGLSLEAKAPDRESLGLRLRLAVRKLSLGALALSSLSLSHGVAEAAGADVWERVKETTADVIETRDELSQLDTDLDASVPLDETTTQPSALQDVKEVDLIQMVAEMYTDMGFAVDTHLYSAKEGEKELLQFDLLLSNESGDKTVVEVKRGTSKAGAEGIHQLETYMEHLGTDSGVLVTTADLTAAAHQRAERAGIQVISGHELEQRLMKYIEHESEDHARDAD